MKLFTTQKTPQLITRKVAQFACVLTDGEWNAWQYNLMKHTHICSRRNYKSAVESRSKFLCPVMWMLQIKWKGIRLEHFNLTVRCELRYFYKTLLVQTSFAIQKFTAIPNWSKLTRCDSFWTGKFISFKISATTTERKKTNRHYSDPSKLERNFVKI